MPSVTPPVTSGGPKPRLRLSRPPSEPHALVLLLHGGAENSLLRASPWQVAALRMLPLSWRIARRGRAQGVVVGRVGYRYRGWNAPHEHPVVDARWALDEARRRLGESLPVVLVGHSMGGRTAVHVADDRDVRAVVALAPWLPRDEPVEALAGRSLMIVHGERDRTTNPKLSYRFAAHTRPDTTVCCIALPRSGHAMLRRARTWHRLASAYALAAVTNEPLPADVAKACARGAAGTIPVTWPAVAAPT